MSLSARFGCSPRLTHDEQSAEPHIIYIHFQPVVCRVAIEGGERLEVLKYGSLIVDACVAYEQPVFVFIPPHAEIRRGSSMGPSRFINQHAVLFCSWRCSRSKRHSNRKVYRQPDLIATMHRIDESLIALDGKVKESSDETERAGLLESIKFTNKLL
jgi:hypothetical protein